MTSIEGRRPRIEADQRPVINWEKGRTEPAVQFVPAVVGSLGRDPFPRGKTLGQRLRAARRARGLSHTALARDFGVDPSTVLNWERGRHSPPVTFWPRIMDLIGRKVLPPDAPLPDRLRAYRQAHGLARLGSE